MLWLVKIEGGGAAYLHAATGRLYEADGSHIYGAVSYTTQDVAPPQPAWWVEPQPPVASVDPALMLRTVQEAIQSMLDAAAQARGFDSIFTAATYIGSAVPKFAADAQALRDWRDLCWATAYAIMDDVLAGAREMPTLADVLAEMPTLG